jgi:hypothetical protein
MELLHLLYRRLFCCFCTYIRQKSNRRDHPIFLAREPPKLPVPSNKTQRVPKNQGVVCRSILQSLEQQKKRWERIGSEAVVRKGKVTIMMGTKKRSFAALIHVSLEELVPQDHFYRHLERTLDLSFVREFVQETYAGRGRPSIDPIVFAHRCNSSCFLRTSALNDCLAHGMRNELSPHWLCALRVLAVFHVDTPRFLTQDVRMCRSTRGSQAEVKSRERKSR